MALELISRGTSSDRRPQLLFLHGGFHDARCWDHHFLPWFAEKGWVAHAMSSRGHGRSPGDLAADKPGLADYAEDINSVISDLGSDVVLIGHSLGGVMAQIVRVQNKSVRGIVLLAASPMRPSLAVAWRMLRSHPVSFFKAQVLGDYEGGKPAFASFFYRDALADTLRQKYLSEVSGESPRAMAELFKRPPPDTSGLDQSPALIIAGRDDWSIPIQDNEWLADTFKAPLRIVPGAHNLMLDPAWEESATAINEWLTSRFI